MTGTRQTQLVMVVILLIILTYVASVVTNAQADPATAILEKTDDTLKDVLVGLNNLIVQQMLGTWTGSVWTGGWLEYVSVETYLYAKLGLIALFVVHKGVAVAGRLIALGLIAIWITARGPIDNELFTTIGDGIKKIVNEGDFAGDGTLEAYYLAGLLILAGIALTFKSGSSLKLSGSLLVWAALSALLCAALLMPKETFMSFLEGDTPAETAQNLKHVKTIGGVALIGAIVWFFYGRKTNA